MILCYEDLHSLYPDRRIFCCTVSLVGDGLDNNITLDDSNYIYKDELTIQLTGVLAHNTTVNHKFHLIGIPWLIITPNHKEQNLKVKTLTIYTKSKNLTKNLHSTAYSISRTIHI